ncbi:MAG: alkaline phosphatase family protein [Chthoniobacteraceae bacterium]
MKFPLLSAFACLGAILMPRPLEAAEYVIAISVDGLRPDRIEFLGPEVLPNFARLRREGAWTHNARTDYDYTLTTPNHVSMVTGRRVVGPEGHNYTDNEPGGTGTIHLNKGSYVAGMFDVAHDHGLKTAVFRSKTKLDIFARSYNATNGAPDLTGEDNGQNKVDRDFYGGSDFFAASMVDQFVAEMPTELYNLTLVHLVDPDPYGHGFNWLTPGYLEAIQRVDHYLGQILGMIDDTPALRGRTTVILTADHGGTGNVHSDAADVLNYRILFYVWGADAHDHGDLYQHNIFTRDDPGDNRPPYGIPLPPIRNGELGNLALQLLGLPPVPGSSINAAQNFSLTRFDFVVADITRANGTITLSWPEIAADFRYTVETAPAADGPWTEASGTTWPIAETSWTDAAPPVDSGYYRVRGTRVIAAAAAVVSQKSPVRHGTKRKIKRRRR